MTFTVLVFSWRREGLTPAQFRALYEDHVALIRRLVGDELFPLTHTRRYLARSEEAPAGYPANVLVGKPADFPYDAVAELVFASNDAFRCFMKRVAAPDVAQSIEADESKFLDRAKLTAVALADTVVTAK